MNQGREGEMDSALLIWTDVCITTVFVISILIDLTRKRFPKNATQSPRVSVSLQTRHYDLIVRVGNCNDPFWRDLPSIYLR